MQWSIVMIYCNINTRRDISRISWWILLVFSQWSKSDGKKKDLTSFLSRCFCCLYTCNEIQSVPMSVKKVWSASWQCGFCGLDCREQHQGTIALKLQSSLLTFPQSWQKGSYPKTQTMHVSHQVCIWVFSGRWKAEGILLRSL